jgi:hypothetical protein
MGCLSLGSRWSGSCRRWNRREVSGDSGGPEGSRGVASPRLITSGGMVRSVEVLQILELKVPAVCMRLQVSMGSRTGGSCGAVASQISREG